MYFLVDLSVSLGRRMRLDVRSLLFRLALLVEEAESAKVGVDLLVHLGNVAIVLDEALHERVVVFAATRLMKYEQQYINTSVHKSTSN